MRKLVVFVAAALAFSATPALAQSSNTSSNSSSNNGVVRERIVDTYCDDGFCERTVTRRTYRDDRRQTRRERERARRQWLRERARERWSDDDDD